MPREFIVLFGHRTNEHGELSLDGKGRCDRAVRLALESPDRIILFCVGYAIPRLQEATVRYLYTQGLPSDQLFTIPCGSTTLEETEAAIEYLDRCDHQGNVILITSTYHMLRVTFLWRLFYCCRFETEASPECENLTMALLHEGGAFAKLFLILLGKSLRIAPKGAREHVSGIH